jgi:hypothetical protein
LSSLGTPLAPSGRAPLADRPPNGASVEDGREADDEPADTDWERPEVDGTADEVDVAGADDDADHAGRA